MSTDFQLSFCFNPRFSQQAPGAVPLTCNAPRAKTLLRNDATCHVTVAKSQPVVARRESCCAIIFEQWKVDALHYRTRENRVPANLPQRVRPRRLSPSRIRCCPRLSSQLHVVLIIYTCGYPSISFVFSLFLSILFYLVFCCRSQLSLKINT